MSLLINVSQGLLVGKTRITQILDSYLPDDLSKSQVSFDIIFASKNKVKKLNDKYLNKNSFTDVLSFPLDQNSQVTTDPHQIMRLGDIFICREMAQRNNHEINFLIVHGFLHLIGLDHSSLRQSVKWDKMEKKIFDEINN